MPMLNFYFPLPFFLIALLSKIFVYNISFKLVIFKMSLINQIKNNKYYLKPK